MIMNGFPTGVKIYTDQIVGLTAVSVANTPGQINLSWANPTSKKFVGVMIRYKAGSYPTGPTDGAQAYSGAGTSASVSGLTGGTTYYFRAFAKATNTSGTKVYYNTETTGAQTAKATIASPVTGLAASRVVNTPGSLTVSWTAPAGAYTNVMIRYRTGSYPTGINDGTQAYLGTGTSTTITGLTGGTQYYIRAFVVNSANEYNTSTVQQAVAYTCPSPVTNLTASYVANTPGSLTVSWTAPAGTYSNVMIRYKKGGYPTGVTDGTQAYLGTATSATITGLTGGTQYYVRAFVVNSASEYNTNTTQQAIAYTCPSPVTSFAVAKTSASSLTVSWAAPAGAYSNVMIRYKTGSYPTSQTDGTQAYLGAGTSVIVTGLSGGTIYYFRAFVVNAATVYNTNTSQQAYNTTKTAAGQVIFTSSQVWTVPAGVTSIDIFVVGGGGGGGVAKSGYGSGAGSGGGGGRVATKKSHAVSPGQQVAVTIGGGGATGSTLYNMPTAGSTGGTTSFAAILSAAGGDGGGGGFTASGTNYEISGGTGPGGSGGSGGGGGGQNIWGGSPGGDAGSDGTNGRNVANYQSKGGLGSGSTTRAFGETVNTLYAGGGGGGACTYYSAGSGDGSRGENGKGGDGGGGDGGRSVTNGGWITYPAGAGATGTGGGGGGGGHAMIKYSSGPNLTKEIGIAGSGGSGICIVRWAEQ